MGSCYIIPINHGVTNFNLFIQCHYIKIILSLKFICMLNHFFSLFDFTIFIFTELILRCYFCNVIDIIWYHLRKLKKVNGRELELNCTYTTIIHLSPNICPGMFSYKIVKLLVSQSSKHSNVYKTNDFFKQY